MPRRYVDNGLQDHSLIFNSVTSKKMALGIFLGISVLKVSLLLTAIAFK